MRSKVNRIDALAWVVFGIMVVIGLRLFYVQVIRYPHYRALQSRQVVDRRDIPARRGRILDRHGRPLAFDIAGYDVSVVKKRLRDKDLPILAELLGEATRDVQRQLGAGERFVTLRRGTTLSPEAVRRLSTLPGVCVEKRTYRQYPYGTLAAQAIGFTDQSGAGAEGIEKAFDEVLRGTPGTLVLLEDEDGEPIGLRSKREPVDGADVHLTIDADLQMIADAELQRAGRDYGARGGCVLLLDPHDGDVLACASYPVPASRQAAYAAEAWRNRSVTDLFEPGSTLKPLTAAAALRHEVVSARTRIFAERGAMRFGSAGVIHDAHEPGDGWLTFTQAFARSSNICFAKIARALTSEDLYDELRAFGFGSLTGVQLPGEVGGQLALPRAWSGRTRLSLGYGHEIGVTAMQLAGLYTTIANGGQLLQPRVVSQIVSRDGEVVQAFAPEAIRQVMPQALARDLQELCRAVVDEGTGDQARIEGVQTAGKTGTAQKSSGGRYVQRFVASFGGFVPAEDPRLVCLVVLDEPRGYYHWGGQSAAPTFQRIVEAILRDSRYLAPRADRIVLVRGRELRDGGEPLAAPQRLASLDPSALPDLRGQRLQVAARWLRRLGVEPRAEGNGIVASQWPAPGAAVERGDVVRLRCKPARPASRHAALWP